MDANVTLEPRETPSEPEAGADSFNAEPIDAASEERLPDPSIASEGPNDTVEPVVSAIVVTYNHEPYIRQAIDSVLSQQVNFPFEIIVSEDKSTDSTAEIVASYAERHPDRIRFIRSEVNLRDNEVLLRAMRIARGRYITFLDGDDYWVSPDKLQTQVDFMEAHPDSAITYHDVERVTDDGEVVRVMKGIGHRGTIEDLTKGNFVGTCSVMIRRSALPQVPDWVEQMPAADWPLYFLAARSGFIDHIPDLVARYRIHTQSFWATRPLAEQLLMGFCMQVEIEANLGAEYAPLFEQSRRANASHVLRTVLNEAPEVRPPPANDIEERLRQAENEAATIGIHLVEMRARVNEAEAQRSEAEQRTLDTLARVHQAESLQLAAERRMVDAVAHVNEKEAQRLDAERQTAEAIARVNEKEAQRLEAERHAVEAIARVNEKEAQRLEADHQTILLQARIQIAEAEFAARGAAYEAAAADLGVRLRRSEEERQNAETSLQSTATALQSTVAAEQELRSALDASNRRIRHIRRRERYIGIGLGVLVAALLILALMMRWT